VHATIANGPGAVGDWVGLFPAGALNTGYLAWAYLNGQHTKPGAGLTAAAVSFTLPLTGGSYEVRLFRNDSLTRIAASGSVTVTAPTVTLDTASAAPGATVFATIAHATGSAGDWVGLFPSGALNTGYLAWAYLNGQHTKPGAGMTDASVSFTLPLTGGLYEVRLFRNDSLTRIATSGSVTVTAPTVTLDTASAAPGATVQATIAHGAGAAGDWVGLFRAGTLNTAYLAWAYLNGQHTKPGLGLTDAALSFTLPLTAGSYEVRLFRNDSLTRIAISGSVTVTAPTVTLDATSAAPGATVQATIAHATGGSGDWVGLFPAGAVNTGYLAWGYLNGQHAKPGVGLTDALVSFKLPLTAGLYEVRLFRNDSLTRIATSDTVTVTMPTVTLDVTNAAPGATVNATIAQGAGATGDWVGLFPTGALSTGYLAWAYLNGQHAKPGVPLTDAVVSFTLPMTAGSYEVRLFRNDSFTQLASSTTVTVP
jgi:hypothetical protein